MRWSMIPEVFSRIPYCNCHRMRQPHLKHLGITGLLILLLVVLIGSAHLQGATTNAARPLPPRIPPATNSLAGAPRSSGTNVVTAAGSKTNAIPQTLWNRKKAQLTQAFQQLRGTRAFYPVVIGVPVCLVLAIFWLSRFFKAKAEEQRAEDSTSGAPSLASRPVKKEAKVHSCNVLQVGAEAQHLWRFEANNGTFTLDRQQTTLPGELLPSKLVAKDWRTLFQNKLNVVWLPSDQVFLRVAHFPRSDFNETLAMVELQLEKLSPIPVTQIVWTIHVLPHTQESLQTVIVLIVAREVVEEMLGRLEGQGYLADRLELPLLDQLQATSITDDGAWIYPHPGQGSNRAMVAWWSGGVLQNLDLVSFQSAPEAASLREQLLQMAWAGDMEGWLKTEPRWHLVADASTAAQWEPVLREGLEQDVKVATPVPEPQLAALTATRAAHSDPRANLLPIEYSTRYHQQFVDRLWMRGLLAVAVIYMLGVAIYGVALGFAIFRTKGLEKTVESLGPQYTNSVQLKARYQILKDRQELKFAALECWNLTARHLPDSATLETMSFIDGKRLALNGRSPASQTKDIYDFETELRKATSTNGDRVFEPESGDHMSYQVQGADIRWNFSLWLKRADIQ
jgi:hypothetical protein